MTRKYSGAIPTIAQYDNTDRRIQLTENENHITMAASRLLNIDYKKQATKKREQICPTRFPVKPIFVGDLTPSL
jgi:hypothetical protein